ncbi:hypothetical protein BHE74_00054703 [Ensete ventricosum]|nr:hypothetical protein GW17_00023219 [Ensete ventricosum]RWW39926.1 hypothetical protein BHE74_00054703 [Ensete ventricosum]
MLRKAKVSDSNGSQDKLTLNWERSYQIIEVILDGTYCLEIIKGVMLSRA